MGQSHIPIALFHVLVIAPFFLYVAFVRGQLMPWIFSALLGLGLVIMVYHAYKTVVKWQAHSLSVWVNIFHVLLIAPLLIYIGASAYDTPRWAFEVLAIFGFGAAGYHLYNMVLEIQEMYNVKKGE
jgi:Na+/melibiose symporter-like transporter